MVQTFLLLGTACVTGFLHAFDADHLLAVSAFISHEPRSRQAVRFALRWGLGHAFPLLLLGGMAIGLGRSLPPDVGRYVELAVGVVLVALGVWLLINLTGVHLHPHHHGVTTHSHFHWHFRREGHTHEHSAFLVGILHGWAGTASVMMVIPVTMISSLPLALGYLGVFSSSVILAMTLYGCSVGNLFHFLSSRYPLSPAFLRGSIAFLSLSLGCVWIVRSL